MRTARRALTGAALGAVLTAGCGDTGPRERAAAADIAAAAPAPPSASSPRGESDGVIGVRVEQPRPRELRVSGTTTSADSTLQVSVEDGHRVLFGPAEVPVRGGRFRVELAHEATDRPTVHVFVTDPAGRHQTVVPVAATARSAAAGPALDGAPPAPAPN